MAKFYATGTKKVTRKNEEGKKETTTVSMVIKVDESVAKNRFQAIKEAAAIAKQEGIVIDGFYSIKGAERGGSTLTKRIQTLRAKGALPKF